VASVSGRRQGRWGHNRWGRHEGGGVMEGSGNVCVKFLVEVKTGTHGGRRRLAPEKVDAPHCVWGGKGLWKSDFVLAHSNDWGEEKPTGQVHFKKGGQKGRTKKCKPSCPKTGEGTHHSHSKLRGARKEGVCWTETSKQIKWAFKGYFGHKILGPSRAKWGGKKLKHLAEGGGGGRGGSHTCRWGLLSSKGKFSRTFWGGKGGGGWGRPTVPKASSTKEGGGGTIQNGPGLKKGGVGRAWDVGQGPGRRVWGPGMHRR